MRNGIIAVSLLLPVVAAGCSGSSGSTASHSSSGPNPTECSRIEEAWSVFKAATGAGASARDKQDAAETFESAIADDGPAQDPATGTLLVMVGHFGDAVLGEEDAQAGDGSLPSAQASASSAADAVATAYAAFTAECG